MAVQGVGTKSTRPRLSVMPVTSAEVLIILAAFLGRFTLQLFQTTIGTIAPLSYHMNDVETGFAFAIFSLGFAAAALIMHQIRPSQLRTVELLALVVLALAMPVFALITGAAAVYTMMAVAGIVTGVVMDAFMTMSGMTARDPRDRQKDQAAFSFWVSLALVISPFVTGAVFYAIHPIDLFVIFAAAPLVSLVFTLLLTGRRALVYTETSGDPHGASLPALLRNAEYRTAMFAALSYTIPFYIALSFGYTLGTAAGLTPSTVFYVFAAMFAADVLTRLYIRAVSPIRDRRPYFAVAVLLGLVSIVLLIFAHVAAWVLTVAFPLAGIADGLVWTLGLQTANQVFDKRDITSATSYFSSGMMLVSVLMPVVGAILVPLGIAATAGIMAAVALLLALPVFVSSHAVTRA